MTRINIDVPDGVHKQAKLEALKNDTTLKEYIIDTLRHKVGEEKS